MGEKKRTPKKAKYTAFLSIPCTPAQKSAILRKARSMAIDFASFGRQTLIKETDYDAAKDPDLPPLSGGMAESEPET